jgi:hypothetical protein
VLPDLDGGGMRSPPITPRQDWPVLINLSLQRVQQINRAAHLEQQDKLMITKLELFDR